MNSEETIYDSKVQSRFGDSATQNTQSIKQPHASVTSVSKNKPADLWQKVAIGGGSGLVFGVGSSILTNAAMREDGAEISSPGNAREEDRPASLFDEEIESATSVSDGMSFSQAFAAARAEVGSGCVFEWHGKLYSTFTAEEWDGMSDEAKDEFNSHFAWSSPREDAGQDNQHGHTGTAPAEVQDGESQADPAVGQAQDETDEADAVPEATDDENEAEVVAGEAVDSETDVQVLGASHLDEMDANVVEMSVGGQDVVLIDMDNDPSQTFDMMAMDLNGDGQIQESEIVDISDQQLTVSDLGGMPLQSGDSMFAANGEADYLNDGNVYEG